MDTPSDPTRRPGDEAGASGIPRPPEGWWERVPVLHELFKLLSSKGPVNWELARQVAVALATYDEEPVADLEGAGRELEAMSRAAEVECEEFTGMVAGTVAPVHALTRAQWVEQNLDTFRFLMEPLAAKMTGGGLAMPLPAEAKAVLEQIGGVLLGLQTGLVLGYLGRHVLGQYELALPQPTGGKLLYVVPNLHGIESDWELEPREFRYWIALHEVTHHLEFSRPWARTYFHGQLKTLIDSLDFDPSRMQEALGDLDFMNPESLAGALDDPEKLIRAAWTPLGRGTAARLQAFMTLAEGYSTFVMDAVGVRVLKDHARLREVMDRRKRTSSPGEQLFERMLGIELKRRQYEDGVKFCRYVAGMRDVAALNRAWDNPDSLPTLEELADPDVWIARVLDAASLEGPAAE